MADDTSKDRAHWTKAANEWIAWARKPGHDAFWAYKDHLINYIGEGCGQALEVGCGEGRVSRVLKHCGYEVTSTDPVAELVKAAQNSDSAHHYAVCAADDLPFPSLSFDLVVAYNVLMDIESMPAALTEMRRVMRPKGLLMISIVHPLADAARFTDGGPEAPFVITEPYFGRKQFEGTEVRDGLQMSFFGWSDSLQGYADALEDAGLAIVSLKEPMPDTHFGAEHMKRWTRMPLFLWLKARSLAP